MWCGNRDIQQQGGDSEAREWDTYHDLTPANDRCDGVHLQCKGPVTARVCCGRTYMDRMGSKESRSGEGFEGHVTCRCVLPGGDAFILEGSGAKEHALADHLGIRFHTASVLAPLHPGEGQAGRQVRVDLE